MHWDIQITTQPLLPGCRLPAELTGRIGAVAEFLGIVRGEENGVVIRALQYEAYETMAEKLLHQIAGDVLARHACLWLQATHRLGIVPVGEAAIHVLVASSHRAEAFAALAEFMERLKQDVPIWKVRALDETAFSNSTPS